LVLDVHGRCFTAADEDAHTNLRALGDQYKYIIVQPTAPQLDSTCAFGAAPIWKPSVDSAPLAKIMDRVSAAWHVDRRRIHFTGFSLGGYMTWLFVCGYSDVLASAAPAASGGPCFVGSTMPSQQIDLLFLMGRKDAEVPLSVTSAQRDAVVAAWGLGQPQTLAQDTMYTRKRYTNSAGTVLETLEHDYVMAGSSNGHCYPGSTATGTQWDGAKCKPPNAFVWGVEVMKFFVAHPKRYTK
jgi:poly(3-hydroxybutyrate) depolymerase